MLLPRCESYSVWSHACAETFISKILRHVGSIIAMKSINPEGAAAVGAMINHQRYIVIRL